MAMNTVPANMYASASLYVGDLAPDVPEGYLYDMFNNVGQVASIRICRDANTRRSLGYAYVNFHRVDDAERALDTMNYKPIHGRPCRIMWSHRDPALRKSGVGNIFVKNLSPTIDNQQLCDTFSKFGNILSCKVSTNSRGEPLGYGFVHYESEEFARKAVEAVNGKMIAGQTVTVAPFKSRNERGTGASFTNLYCKNIPLTFSDEEFEKTFSQFGTVTSSKVIRDAEGKSKGFGFVNLTNADEAKAAVDAMNGQELPDGKAWYVSRAQKKEERQKQLREQFEHMKIERQKKYAGVNLYVKNLSDKIDDARLRTEFAQFGSITSAVVMQDKQKKSKGFGFVCFSTQEEAMKAMTEMNGRMLDAKPLYVALAQRAEERKARFEARWASRQGKPGMPQPIHYGVPPMGPPRPMVFNQMMHPGWTNQPLPMGRLGPQMNYALMPAANRTGGPPRRGGRGRGAPVPNGQQPQGPRPGQQQFKYNDQVRNQRQQPPQQQPQPVPQPAPQEAEADFVKELAAMPEDQRKHVIGERLYPLVLEAEPEKAPKITGMLLEMENAEIIELLDSPEALQKKINEALDVLSKSEGDQ